MNDKDLLDKLVKEKQKKIIKYLGFDIEKEEVDLFLCSLYYNINNHKAPKICDEYILINKLVDLVELLNTETISINDIGLVANTLQHHFNDNNSEKISGFFQNLYKNIF